MMFDKLETRRIIESAFDRTPRPEVSLRQFVLTDQKGMSGIITDEEWDLAGILRTDAKWQDITALEIKYCDCQLAHMQAEEFRYYLPAYMLYSLDHAQDSILEGRIPSSVIFGLTPGEYDASYSASQYSLLDRPQRQAVAAFLRYMANNADDYDRSSAVKALAFWALYT